MINKSRHKCYPSDIEHVAESTVHVKTYPDFIDNPNIYVQDTSVVKSDPLSNNATIVSLISGYYNDDDNKMYALLRPIDALKCGNDIIVNAIEALETELKLANKWKYNHALLCMYLSGKINKIKLYCKGLASNEFDNPMNGRYIIVVAGYSIDDTGAERRKIDYEIITDKSYVMHPNYIIPDMETEIENLKLTDVVDIDKDSFEKGISKITGYVSRDMIIKEALAQLDNKIDNMK